MVGLAVVAVAAMLVLRWNEAPIHGATPVFTRTTRDGIRIEAEHGDVRVSRIFCADGSSCTTREPGVLVRFLLPDGRTGGGMPVPDAGYAPPTSGPSTVASTVTRVVTRTGLGAAPGSSDEQSIVVRTGPEVVRVRATRPDGSIDEMAPVEGLVILATRTGWATGHPVEAFDANGAPVTVVG